MSRMSTADQSRIVVHARPPTVGPEGGQPLCEACAREHREELLVQ